MVALTGAGGRASPPEQPREPHRATARKPVQLAVRLSHDDGWMLDGWLVDLGLGGAGVFVGRELPPGAPVRVQIDAPNLWDPLLLPATVAWTGRFEAARGGARGGVRFAALNPTTALALLDLMGSEDYE